MDLFSKKDIIAIAFINYIEEADLKNEIIVTAFNKYIVPVITPAITVQLIDYPDRFEELINSYIKPCLAFYVKYMHLNQLTIESRSFYTSEMKSSDINAKDLAAEVYAIAEQKKQDLVLYMNDFLPNDASTNIKNKKLINGFLI